MDKSDLITLALVTATILAVVYINRKMNSPLQRLLPGTMAPA